MSTMVTERPHSDSSRPALLVGVLALVAFFGLGFAFDGWFFLVGAALGLVAVVLGLRSRRSSTEPSERRRATLSIAAGALPVVWFVVYMVVVGISDLT